MIIDKGATIPNKVRSHDRNRKKRLSKMSQLLPANLKRARKFRSSGLWQSIRASKLKADPLCADPFSTHHKEGGAVGGVQVHHIEGLATHYHLKAVFSNLASICTKCHSKIEILERQNKNTTYLFK